MQYYNQHCCSSYTGYQTQADISKLGYQADTSYPWYSQISSYPAAKHGVQQCYNQQPYAHTDVSSYSRERLSSDFTQNNGHRYQVTEVDQISQTINPNCHTVESQCGNQINTMATTQNNVHRNQMTGGNQKAEASNQYCNVLDSQPRNNHATMATTQNHHTIKNCQAGTGSHIVVSSNPLTMNFINLRQAIEDESEPVKEDRKKYGDRKPPYSYVAMIHMAMSSNPSKKCTLKEILDYIQDRFPYYTQHSRKLHGAIRHNLTLNDCFIKAGRRLGDKGCLWTLDKEYEGMFEHGGSLLRRKCRLLEGRVDKYKRNKNSKKSRKSATSKSDMDCNAQQDTDCVINDQSTGSIGASPSSVSTYSNSHNEGSSCESTPATTASSPTEDSGISLFDLEQFVDICTFPEFNCINQENVVTSVCRRLSTELSEELLSPGQCSRTNEADNATESDYSPCAFSTGWRSDNLLVSSPALGDFSKSEMPGKDVQCDVQFPDFLDIPDILNEVDTSQSGFNYDFWSCNEVK